MPEIIPAIIAKSFDELEEKIKLIEPYLKTVQIDVMDGIFVSNKTWPYTEYNCHPEFVSGSDGDGEMPKQVRHDKKISFIDELDNLETDLILEAHLMVENPYRALNEWLNSKVKRIILHWEAINSSFCHSGLDPESKSAEKIKNLDSRFRGNDKEEDMTTKIKDFAKQIHNSGKEFGMALNPKTPIEVLDNFINDIDLVLLMSVDPGFAGQEFKEAIIPKIIALRQLYPDVKIEVDGGVSPQNIAKLVEAGADFLVMGSAIFANSDPQLAIEEAYGAINKK